MLGAIKTIRKTGKESLYFNNKELSINILSFWQWSASELLDNTRRGIFAEFIIASAIDILHNPRKEWDAYDLITNNGLKIEVKSSSYLQSWQQDKLSSIIFGIQPTIAWDENGNRTTNRIRQSDIYVFCVLAHKDKSTVNPIDLSQWDFYILDTDILNEKVEMQKSISLSSLLKLKPIKVKYDNLKIEIDKIEQYKL